MVNSTGIGRRADESCWAAAVVRTERAGARMLYLASPASAYITSQELIAGWRLYGGVDAVSPGVRHFFKF